MSRVTFGERAYNPVEVDLWGNSFTTKAVTRSLTKRAAEIEKRLSDIEDPDELVDALAELIDLRLEPANGKKTKPSALIQRKWKADELSIDDLLDFGNDLAAADRPT